MSLPVVSVTISTVVSARQYMNSRDGSLVLALAAQVQPRTVIEIGVNFGFTAQMLLLNLKCIERYIGIDVPLGTMTEIPEQMSETPDRPGLVIGDPRFELIMRPRGSQELAPGDLPRAEFIFIDGDHGYQAVMRDSQLAVKRINAGGIICWHDYGNTVVQVTRALDALHEFGWNIQAVEDSWIAFEKFE